MLVCVQKKQLAGLSKKGSLLSKPMGSSEKQQIQRAVAYEQTSKDLAKWIPSVKANREADHLSFPLKHESQREDASNAGLTAKFVERTGLETEVAAVLRASMAIEQQDKGLTESEQVGVMATCIPAQLACHAPSPLQWRHTRCPLPALPTGTHVPRLAHHADRRAQGSSNRYHFQMHAQS